MWSTVIFAPITDKLGSVLYQLRWVGEVAHLNRSPILRSTINNSKHTHTHTHNTHTHWACQCTSSMANYSQNVKVQLCSMEAMEKKEHMCVCVCVFKPRVTEWEKVCQREREKDNGRMKEAGRKYCSICIHQMSTHFHYILLNKAYGKHGSGQSSSRPDCADRGTVALFQNL